MYDVSKSPTPRFRRLFRTLFVKPLLALGRRWGFLKDNLLWRSLKPYYHYFFEVRMLEHLGENAAAFYDQNADRVNALANALADETSRRIYLGMIKFRQTRDRKDYPLHRFREAQYFLKELKLGNDEVYIDCGASYGDSIDPFLRRCRKYKRIVAFEPDPESFEALRKRYGNNPKITLLNAGLYDRDGEVSFSGGQAGRSKIADGAQEGVTGSIPVKAIDGLELDCVTFIKMDVEGAELSALKGARKTILRHKPKLAISIYHSEEDMIRLAEYVRELVPEYKLYVRHYGFTTETVLYAVTP